MATRIRTLNFLPEIFQTTTNSQFLQATLDQLVDQPNTQRIQGYIGSKFGYSINAKDFYVTEPTKTRTDYQLEPGVVFTTDNNQTAQDFISYPGIIDALSAQGGLVDDQNRLFNSQIYAWDSFTNLDPLVNFNQYYWLPEGPERVVISQEEVSRLEDYVVQDFPSYYNISPVGTTDTTIDPEITLLRGGRYTFSVNQNSKFWIQGSPGVTGLDPTQTNVSTRDIFGVTNNGIEQGTITFDVPFRDAQNQFVLPGNISVDVVSSIPFHELNGAPVNSLSGIDGITALDNLTVLFYNTGFANEIGYISDFFDQNSPYDVNSNLITPTTIVVTNTNSATNLVTCDATSGLVVGQTITFAGTPFGGINQYQTGVPLSYGTSSINTGEMYYINDVGDTDWISIGVQPSAEVNGYISGNVLFVDSTLGGSLESGLTLDGTGVTAGTKIIKKFIGTTFDGYIDDGTGSVGTVLTVTTVYPDTNGGDLAVGTVITGLDVPAGLTITGFLTGTGGIGTYTVSSNVLLAATNLIGSAPSGYEMYQVDTFQTVSATDMFGYNITEGKLFTATSAASGTGIVTPYLPTTYYVSSIVNSTQFTIASELNEYVTAPYIQIGKSYIISYVGNTDFTLLGASSNTVGTVFLATQVGNGTGAATELVNAGNFMYETQYKITSLGTTNWNTVAGTVAITYSVGDIITAVNPGAGTGTALPFVDVVLTTATGSMIGYTNQGLFEEGYYTDVNQNIYRITYIGEPGSQVISLVPDSLIPSEQKITATYGTQYINRSFFRSIEGTVQIVPYISAVLDTLYYQDGTVPGKFGTIKLIESNALNTLNIESDILGKKSYTATNGVVFTNGLKVTFQGSINPTTYLNNEYYVEGVGTAIELLPVADLIAPEAFTGSVLIPWDTTGWDVTNYEGNSYIPIYQDYITIARNSINKNSWSRSNRWFHISVIEATANYNNNPQLLSLYATESNKAKRPIIEFYPNLKLFNSGNTGKSPVDFIDFRTNDAFSLVAGQQNYYPDVETYTEYTATIESTDYVTNRKATATNGSNGYITCDDTEGFRKNDTIVFDSAVLDPVFGGIQPGVTYYISEIINSTTFTMSESYNGPIVTLSTYPMPGDPSLETRFFWSPRGTNISIDSSAILAGTFQVAQYIADSTNLLPKNTYITDIETAGTTINLTVYWGSFSTKQPGTTVASLVAAPTPMSNFALFDGARVVFAGDTNENVRNKVYISRFTELTNSSTPVITLSEAADGEVITLEQVVAFRGYNYQGLDFYFDGANWIESQLKTTVNQPPLFDVFDKNNISFGDKTVYSGSSFAGSKLFSYGIGSGINDFILGFPLRYTSVNNVNDISFDVNINTDSFTYVEGLAPVTRQVNTGYVFNYIDNSDYIREIGWKTTVSPSTQYQLFSFNYDPIVNSTIFICDVAANLETEWPTVLVYNNNNYLTKDSYVVNTTETSTTITLNTAPIVETVIQILILSTQVSKTAYYTIPLNLSNNPLNENLASVSVGELRLQYQSIYINKQDISGPIFGSNNFRDLGNLVPYANQIIQNSASLVLPGAFLRKQEHNLFNALAFNNIEYIKFKTLLINTTDAIVTQQTFNPAEMLDMVLDSIATTKTSDQPFFWSDMLPNKAVFITNTYKFANSLDTSIYPLSRVYDFSTANYYGVLVYLTRTISNISVTKQLIKDVDYTISSDSPSLTVTLGLLPNDVITIKEYNQTFGSYAPNTPTKLGLYPKFIPQIILDTDYSTPTYFIRGHDGSYNKLYGEYNQQLGVLIDFRDQVLFEFEKRIYNNLKLSAVIPVEFYEIEPGFFRKTEYTEDEFLDIYSKTFLDWVGTNRVDYKTQLFNKLNQLTFNYFESGNKINKEPILQGYWRGIYKYYYDTFTPNLTPWQMIGYSDQPTWWESQYGPAPYTSDNIILWEDLARGYDYNNGNPRIIPWAIRPELLRVLPVDSSGNLVSPFVSIVGNYTSSTFQRDWKIGDIAPTELSYRRSSSWPFDLMRIQALTKPAKFFNLGVDVDHYKYNAEFDQYLVNDRSHLTMADIEVYGNGKPVTSFINWIVDYEKQIGLNATTNIISMLGSLDVRLVYRLAGFSDKNLLKFYVEKGNPNNTNASLLIPDESYQVLLYDNVPFDKIVYSNIIVQLTQDGGYAVFGNSQTRPVFVGLEPVNDGNFTNLTVENVSVKLPQNYSNKDKIIPYGTVFYSVQEVALFINSVGAKLTSQGMVFDYLENAIEVNWSQMVAEFLYYSQTGWEPGSIVTLNPAAQSLKIDRDSYIVQPLTLQNTNFVLNDNLYPILTQDLNIVRDGTMFNAIPLNQGDAISYGQFNISNFENGIVFNNLTLFDDVIYNLVTGLRQQRIVVNGWKTAEWNGLIDAQGFILNQDNIKEWSKEAKYTKGEIVKYKNKYWTALKIVQPGNLFNEQEWKQTDYDTIQKGLLPNASTRAYESTVYYNTNRANLENDGDLLSFSLIGYRPREYMSLADLSDITQINVYQNLIKQKGTPLAANAFKGAKLPQGGIQYDIHENWAIKSGEFGAVLNSNYIEILLNEKYLTGNPATLALTNGEIYTAQVQQQVPLSSIFNYGRPITSANILPTVSSEEPSRVFPDAGYVNFNDVKMSSYYYSGMNTATDTNNIIVPITELLVRDYVWIANYREQWQVVTPKQLGQIIFAKNNLNNTVTIQFAQPHNLEQYQTFAVVNFDANIDGYYVATLIPNPDTVIIDLALNPSIRTVNGLGVAMQFQNQRVATPTDINSLPLLDSEFIKNTVWVDTDSDGSWAVYRKSINYTYENEITKSNSSTFGSAVATSSSLGYLIGDSGEGKVYRYIFSPLNNSYSIAQTLTESISFGSNITYIDNIVIITEPDSGTLRLYQLIVGNIEIAGDIVDNLLIDLQTISINCDSVAMSGDKLWMYVGDIANAEMNVYHKTTPTAVAGSFVTGTLYTISSVGTTDFTSIGSIDNNVGTMFVATGAGTGTGTATFTTYSLVDTQSTGLVSNDSFGYSISTNYDGSVIVVGAPDEDYNPSTFNWGKAYVYNRLVQNIEATYTNVPVIQPESYILAWTPAVVPSRTGSQVSSNFITANATMVGYEDTPVIFQGINNNVNDFKNTGVIPNTVYYVDTVVGSTFSIKQDINGSALTLTNASGLAFNIYLQVNTLDVSVNGTMVDENNYGIIGNKFVYLNQLYAGDIVTVSGSYISSGQTLSSPNNPRIGVKYSNSLDLNTNGNELLIGAPFELTTNNVEGAVYRYTDAGKSFGTVIGTDTVLVTANRKLLINGYLITITPGTATDVATTINRAGITNIQASNSSGKIIISLLDNNLSVPNQKLTLSSDDYTTFTELGIEVYSLTQTVLCPHNVGPTQFGKAVKFNEYGSFVATAPTGTRYESTTFDFVDNENDDDTVFDNNTTQFVDFCLNAGAAYMFDYLNKYNESLGNIGQYVYAQSVNSTNEEYGLQPYYGLSVDFNNNKVIIGSPMFRPNIVNGQVIVYENSTSETQDWSVYRKSANVVDISKISTIQIFDRTTNNTLINLDYFDPLQGKILGAARENIDFISNTDPARYNITTNNVSTSGWGAEFVGMIWFDTSTTKFVNYHQNDLVYNTKYWGTVFPGSEVDIYTWISSPVEPVNYAGPGTVFNNTSFATQYVINQTGQLAPVYYYWVKNTNIVFTESGKSLADSTISSYIRSPANSGISYFAPLLPNSFGIYNSASYIQSLNSILSLNFATGSSDDTTHNIFDLIRSNYPDDFLPGVPSVTSINKEPISLYAKYIDSFGGTDKFGNVVPDPFLPIAVQSGILNRPKQSFFLNRLNALKNYIELSNEVLLSAPFVEFINSTYIYSVGATNPSTDPATNQDPTSPFYSPTYNGSVLPFYDTTAYWEFVNYWIPGYDDNTKAIVQVQFYADLSTLTVEDGTIATVAANGTFGLPETYIYTEIDGWTRIGVTNGTIRINSSIWNYADNGIGFGNNFYDTVPFDQYPSEETKFIIRALNEELPQIYNTFRNDSLILMFEYIQAETIESQNYLTWLNKTSLVDVSHAIRELIPYQTYKSDNQDFLAGYINEVKPYHVVIKDFLFKYTGSEVFAGNVTDFDLPAKYNSTFETFISPQLVYANQSNEYQYLPTSDIWNDASYNQWFANYGLGLTGQPEYLICSLTTYIALNARYFFVDNSSGLPSTGTLRIGEEKIEYTEVDRSLNLVGGLTRGVDNTPISTHIPGNSIYIDLPGVIVLNPGRGYTAPPRVIAYTDPVLYPAPRKAAILEPVVAGDQVISITVVDPGEGYAVTPIIQIDPAVTIPFDSESVNTTFSTIKLYAPFLQTGDIVQYKTNAGSEAVGGLVDNQWYYVNLLESSPLVVIALYDTYNDAVNDTGRITLSTTGTGTNTINQGARATAVASSIPVRENIISLKYDRTSYNPSVIVWREGEFYGAYYAGLYNNTLSTSSSSIQLASTQPPIESILASSQGVSFEIVSVRNEQTLVWSSLERDVAVLFSNGTVKLIPKVFSFEGIGGIVGNVLTVSSISYGEITSGTILYTLPSVEVVSQISGIPGGAGTYEILNSPGTVSSGTIQGIKPNTSGTTLGMTIGMPVQFVGFTGDSGVNNEVTYYVAQVVNSLEFTIASDSETLAPITLSNTYVITQLGLKLLVSEVINKAILTVYYPGITTATQTTAQSNKITIPLNISGTGGTNNFYIGMPVFFTGNVFGGIIENDIYYVNGILDNQNFIASSQNNAVINNVIETKAATDSIVLNVTNDNYAINEPVIFSELIGGNFGSLQSEIVYYIVGKIGTNEIQVSTSINGTVYEVTDDGPIDPNDYSGKNVIISQKNAVQLSTASGNMTININLPVSPGQINGQLFNAYKTSVQYPNLQGTIGDLIERTITATLGTINRVTFLDIDGGLDDLYVNMPLVVADTMGGLSASTLYYIKGLGRTIITSNSTLANTNSATFTGSISGFTMTVTGISGFLNLGAIISGTGVAPGTRIISQTPTFTGGNGTYIVSISQTVGPVTINAFVGTVVCNEPNATDRLYVNMPITFTGAGIGGVNINQEYYVAGIIDGTKFALSNLQNGEVITISNGTGTMNGVGEPWITVSTTPSGSEVSLTDVVDTNSFLQSPTTVPAFDVSYIMGGYRVIISNPGAGFAVNNTITIQGTTFGATSKNNLTLIVNAINTNGLITSVICEGVTPDSENQYYLKVSSPNELEVFSNQLMTVPVSGLELPYVGITSDTVTQLDGTDIYVDTYTNFFINDEVVFTGNVSGNIILGKPYYIVSTPSSTVIQISEEPGGTAFNAGTVASTEFSIAKLGDYIVLPEPFYFNQSIVKYNGQLYVCIISNNDDTFVPGKWQLLNSDSRRINGLDRIIGYYTPTDEMPGVDVSQLVTGIRYPNSVYLGNAFQPDEQFELDTILASTTFYPTQLNLIAVANKLDQDGLIAVLNTDEYSGYTLSNGYTSGQPINWVVNKLSNTNINITNIKTVTGKYIITTANYPNNIILGTPTELGTIEFESIQTPSRIINDVVENNGLLVAVGDSIIVSTDGGENWIAIVSQLSNDPRLTFQLKSITHVSTSGFTGYIAVGSGQLLDYSSGLTYIVDTNSVYYSTDGYIWNTTAPFTYNEFISVASNGTNIVAVGENNVIYYSINGSKWIGVTETNVLNTNGVTNSIIVSAVNQFSVDDKIQFYGTPFGGLSNDTFYYIASIDSATSSITLSLEPAGVSPVTISTGSPVNLSLFSKVLETTSVNTNYVNLNDIYYSEEFSKYITVGDSGFIFESTDGLTWPAALEFKTSEQHLFGILDSETNSVPYSIVVGGNNFIAASADPSVSWDDPRTEFTRPEQVYSIQGDAFTSGYGPEELVPGIVSDNMTMLVTTRPGTNWPVVEYGHVGFKVISKEITPTFFPQFIYSFANVAQSPSQIRVSVISRNTSSFYSLGEQGLYEGIDYTVNWINKTVTLFNSIQTNQFIRIDVYSVGNGDQLVKSNTDIDPIRYNQSTEWYEIYLNCNYSANIFNGSGIIQPGSEPRQVVAFETEQETNSIYCVRVTEFALNDPITFQGAVFGNIQEDVTYYVKTISYASRTITVSTSFNTITGTAGPTVNLVDATGSMFAIVQIGTGTTYSDPFVFHNGTKLVHGFTGTTTKMQSSNNTLTVNSTEGLIVKSKISFNSNMFGNVSGGILNADEIESGTTYRINSLGNTNFTSIGASLNPTVGEVFVSTGEGSGTGTVTAIYYINTIVDDNQFTISSVYDSVLDILGPVKTLVNATGGAGFITNDYSFGIQPNGIQATLVFVYPYDVQNDFIAFTLFGETEPAQYGGTLPQCELFIGDGVEDTFALANFNGGANPENAIVEIDGYRLPLTDYTIDDTLDNIVFVTPPALNATIAVTMYNLTDRQYFTTNTYTGKTVSSIINVQNAIFPRIAQAFIDSTDSVTNYITVQSGSTTDGFVVGQYIQFFGTGIGGIQTDGTVYVVTNIVDSQNFEINFTITATESGGMSAVVGGQSTTRITTLNPHGLATNDLIRIDGVLGSVQLNNNLYYVHVFSTTQFDIYAFDPSDPTKGYDPYGVNNIVANVSSYIGNGFAWKSQSFILSTTNIVATFSVDGFTSNVIITTDSSELIVGTPIIFMQEDVLVDDNIIGGIVAGETYFIKSILDDNKFTISETRDGTTFALTNSSTVSVESLTIGVTYAIAKLGTTNQTEWNTIAGTTGVIYKAGDIFVAAAAGTPGVNVGQASTIFNVTANQWNQNNTDRLWVTVNGERIPSSSLRVNPGNNISILAEVAPGDDILITSMIPSSTPDEETYLLNVSQTNTPSVYRANYNTKTWLTYPLGLYDTTIKVQNAVDLIDIINQTSTVGAPIGGEFFVGLQANRNLITGITIFNQTQNSTIPSTNYTIEIIDLVPTVIISSGCAQNDILQISIYEGNLLYINGEQIRFDSINLETNILSGLSRGVNGTGVQLIVPSFTLVYSILSTNKLPDTQYDKTWNPIPGIYNVSQGDPLQIAETSAAIFLDPSPTRNVLNQ